MSVPDTKARSETETMIELQASEMTRLEGMVQELAKDRDEAVNVVGSKAIEIERLNGTVRELTRAKDDAEATARSRAGEITRLEAKLRGVIGHAKHSEWTNGRVSHFSSLHKPPLVKLSLETVLSSC
jgi:hypothetical protein